ncbi:hypothetical protein pb186bvf_005441 [Paramecium bursaria]
MAEAQLNKKVRVLIAGSKRVYKEYFLYVQEHQSLNAERQKAIQAGADNYKLDKMVFINHLHQQQQLLDETNSMFANVRLRLDAIVQELEQIILQPIDDPALLNEAQVTINEMRTFLLIIQAAG